MKDLWEFPIADFLVLARPDVLGLYILSPSARLIWELKQSGMPLSKIVRKFASTCDIPQELAQQDVQRTLDLWTSGLLSHRQNLPSINSGAEVRLQLNAALFSGDFVVHGKNVRVILDTPGLVEEIGPRLVPLAHARSTPDFIFRVVERSDGFHIFSGECCIASEVEIGAVRGVLLQEIVRSCRGRDCLAVFHAGACGSNSRCIVFPATTHSGKTTLAAVLMKTGLTLYGDDSVLLERDTLSVPAMPFALAIREGSWDILYSRFPELHAAPVVYRYGQKVRFLPPEAIEEDGHSGQVGALVFVRYERGAINEISSLDTLEALLRLQESGFWVAHDEQSIRAFLLWLHSTASFCLSYSDVDEAASIIRGLLV